ncbi:uncharacterized protein LOC119095012 [Pollicipes pollicipes]|uniref:uncharacterized protein LOC119095012 n=1 Tax=Pollicipes pollicipes TaxID=41117 RepID=UPI0018856254|nr:uncharacterized protein LOC119095012 [Pollicipes pollicipes]
MRGVQAAVALRRQRSRREERKRRAHQLLAGERDAAALYRRRLRRGGAGAGTGALAQHSLRHHALHIGLVFLFIGFLMVITAMIPGTWRRMRGVQAAVALRRQRSRREERKRRLTNSSLESVTPRPSTGDGFVEEEPAPAPARSRSILFGITLFHIGLVFLFIGFLMVITAMIPGYMEKAEAYDLVGTGTFFVVLGGVLTLVNRVISRREEDSLQEYVSGRLARSRSGGRLMRDTEASLAAEAALAGIAEETVGLGKDSSGDSQAALLGVAEPRDYTAKARG